MHLTPKEEYLIVVEPMPVNGKEFFFEEMFVGYDPTPTIYFFVFCFFVVSSCTLVELFGKVGIPGFFPWISWWFLWR